MAVTPFHITWYNCARILDHFHVQVSISFIGSYILLHSFPILFMPLRSKIGAHIVFVLSVIPSFCHSLLLSETLTLLITFEQ